MRHYEIVFLVHPDQSEQVPGMIDRYTNMIKSKGGTIHRLEDWGRRQLAYPINKIYKAHYVLMNIECDQEVRDELDSMANDPQGCLALIILLDQFSRNMFRGSAQAFAADEKALAHARTAVERGLDQQLPPFQRTFVYLPFEHSESLADQDRSVALFEALGDENTYDYAVRHRDIIVRFGRFPHRNVILGRESTPEELEFLKEPGSSFGGQTPSQPSDA